MKEQLKLTKEQAQNIAWDISCEFNTVKQDVVDTTRWSIHYSKIAKRLSDGKFFVFNYSVGATECQDERPYEYEDEVVVNEVFPVEKTITVYE